MNGTQAKIIGVDKETGSIIAETKTGERITLNPARAESLDYSYARTVHMSQGATFDGTIYAGEAGKMSTAELGYVALSRERLWLRIITDNPDALCKSLEKFADKQTALKASRTPSPEKLEEIKAARRAAGKDLGHTGAFAKKRAAANEAAAQAGPTLGDTAAIPDALDPDFGSDKFAKKMNAAMEKIADKQQAAGNAESAVLNTPSPASARDDALDRQEPERGAQPAPPPAIEVERELGE